MNIGDAARATRKYSVYHAPGEHYWIVSPAPSVSQMRDFRIKAALPSEREAQAACDRLNLIAVMEAIRDTSLDSHRRAVLDAIIEEVGK